jgi:hypothetical protein
MKPLYIIFWAIFAASCAENTPPAEEVRDHFERGISGQGKIVPLGDPNEPVPPPASSPPALQP